MSTQHHNTGKLPTVKKHNCTSTSLRERERERERAVTDCFYVSFQLFTVVINCWFSTRFLQHVVVECSEVLAEITPSIFRVTVWFTWMLKSGTCNHCMVQKPKRRPASAFVILNYVQSLPAENNILTIFTLWIAMNLHVSCNLQLPNF
jgi:hypothetical protein